MLPSWNEKEEKHEAARFYVSPLKNWMKINTFPYKRLWAWWSCLLRWKCFPLELSPQPIIFQQQEIHTLFWEEGTAAICSFSAAFPGHQLPDIKHWISIAMDQPLITASCRKLMPMWGHWEWVLHVEADAFWVKSPTAPFSSDRDTG